MQFNNSKYQINDFQSLLIYRVVERSTSVFTDNNGMTERKMTEKIIVEFNNNLVNNLLSENKALRLELEAMQKSDLKSDWETYLSIIGTLLAYLLK